MLGQQRVSRDRCRCALALPDSLNSGPALSLHHPERPLPLERKTIFILIPKLAQLLHVPRVQLVDGGLACAVSRSPRM